MKDFIKAFYVVAVIGLGVGIVTTVYRLSERKGEMQMKCLIISLLILTGCATQPPYELYKTQKDFEAYRDGSNKNIQRIAQFINQLSARVDKLEKTGVDTGNQAAVPVADPAKKE